jgi:NodT family efflux transporter outer membrane factor (OMF) lipoprotein
MFHLTSGLWPSNLLRTVPLTAVVAALLAGCASSKAPQGHEPSVPAAFKESALWAKAGQGAQTPAVSDAWWQLFGDAELDRLQAQLLVGNENLQGLAAQVAQAKALLDAAQGARSPTLTAGLNASRADAAGDAGSKPRNSFGLQASASWELDLWGRLSGAANVAESRFRASELDLASARLSAQATLTQTYLALQAAKAQEALLTRSLAVYTRSLELARARYETGVAAQTDVLQAQTQLKTTQIQQAEARSQQALLSHALASLLGKVPSEIEPRAGAILPAVPAVPSLVPADLLKRRPDIAAAQERVKAAYAQVGVSEAALLPALSLSGSFGYRGGEIGQLITNPHQAWSLGAGLLQTLLDGGIKRAATEQARAQAEQAASTLRQTVLNAMVEVEDNLVLASQLQSQADLQREAVAYAARNLQITEDQYRVGTVSYVNVVLAQATALTAERGLLDLQSRQLAAVNQLLKNVAGRL